MIAVTFPRVVRSEWTKFWSLRSTWIVLWATAVATTGLAGVIGWVQRGQSDGPPPIEQTVGGAFLGIDLFTLVIGVFGVLLMTGEYSSGLIRSTLAAVPKRLPVLWAKALVLGVVAGALLVVVCFASIMTARAFSGTDVGFGDPGVLRATFGAAAAPAAFGLIGVGLGAMLRHTAGSITVLVAVMLVIPALLPAALTDSVRQDVTPYSPVAASQAMYSINGSGGPFEMLAPGIAALVLAGWVALALAGGAAVLRRRDA